MTYLERLVLEDAAAKFPLELPERLYYLHARQNSAADNAEREIIGAAIAELRNGVREASEVPA